MRPSDPLPPAMRLLGETLAWQTQVATLLLTLPWRTAQGFLPAPAPATPAPAVATAEDEDVEELP